MTILEKMAQDAQQAQARQAAIWSRNVHPTLIYVPDRHCYQPIATRGLSECTIPDPMIALAVDYDL